MVHFFRSKYGVRLQVLYGRLPILSRGRCFRCYLFRLPSLWPECILLSLMGYLLCGIHRGGTEWALLLPILRPPIQLLFPSPCRS